MRQYDLPLYTEIGGANGKAYPEVATALTGTSVPIVRINDKGELVVSVAVPIQRMRAVLGVLLLSTAAATSTTSSRPSAGASCACRCSPRPSPSCCR